MTHLPEVTIRDRPSTVYVEIGPPAEIPALGFTVRVGDKWCSILSVRDWYGVEHVEEITAYAVLEIVEQMRSIASEVR